MDKEYVFFTFVESVSLIGIIILLFRLCAALQKAWKAGNLSKLCLKIALTSEFNLEVAKRDASRGLLIGCISVLASLMITEWNSRLVVCLLSHFIFLFRTKENDVAIGLAWSYYFGYLKIILPKFVENSNNSKHKDYLLRKLFVLVPADCKIYDRLNNADPNLEYAENLSAIRQNVAGIHVRKYVNTLYRVRVEGEEFYAAIEYATPLKTLRCMSDHKGAELSKAGRDRQVEVFLQTIKNILLNHSDPPEMRDRIEFIYLEDGVSIAQEIHKTVLASKRF